MASFEERTDEHFEKLFNILEGKNGDDGLIVKVDRNTQFRNAVVDEDVLKNAGFVREAKWSVRAAYAAIISAITRPWEWF